MTMDRSELDLPRRQQRRRPGGAAVYAEEDGDGSDEEDVDEEEARGLYIMDDGAQGSVSAVSARGRVAFGEVADLDSPREGDLLDVLGRRRRWREAVVVDVDESEPHLCQVHFLFSDEAEDIMVSVRNESKVAAYGTHCFVPELGRQRNVRVGQRVDFVDFHPARMQFVQGEIVQVLQHGHVNVRVLGDGSNTLVQTHVQFMYMFGSKTFPPTHVDNMRRSDFLRRLRSVNPQASMSTEIPSWTSDSHETDDLMMMDGAEGSSRKRGAYNNNAIGYSKKRERGIRSHGDPRYERYREALHAQNMEVVPMAPDGNCLFRAVSHQVYGTPDHHRLVRESCMDYMESERTYFEPFVVGGFEDYVSQKRRHGVWGDDLEIQAMCEIYDRPAEVMAYDPVLGAKPLRTFHEMDDGRRRPPMILSFYGGGHYDSIVTEDFYDFLLDASPGELGTLEKNRIALSRARHSGQTEEELAAKLSSSEKSEQAVLDEAIKQSRGQYLDSADQDLEKALSESLAQVEREERAQLEGAVLESEASAALRESDLAATEEDQLKEVLKLSQEEDMQQALALSESAELERALKMSRADQSSASNEEEDSDDLQRAIQLSLQE